MNNASLIVSALSLFATVTLVGCADDSESAKQEPEDKQTITGQLDTGSASSKSGLSTKTVTVNGDGDLHVVAHRLGTKDRVGGDVDAIVAADGSFDLALSRGARYVFEVERGHESVAYFGWSARGSAEKTTVLGIATTTKGKAAVSLGHVKIVGNGAVPEVSLSESFDESDTTGIDLTATYFVSAKGALVTASEALQEASAALQEASAALQEASEQVREAGEQVNEAQQQAEEAARRTQEAANAH